MSNDVDKKAHSFLPLKSGNVRGDLVPTTLPHVLCTGLPKHWRSNKSLPVPFRVISLLPISDGTRVHISAGNEERPHAELKNSTAVMHAQEARFSDLRFLGRSGRGKSFNVNIHIETNPHQLAVYAKAIKVTVDGPRVPRNKYAAMHRMERALQHAAKSGCKSMMCSPGQVKEASNESSKKAFLSSLYSACGSSSNGNNMSALRPRKRKYHYDSSNKCPPMNFQNMRRNTKISEENDKNDRANMEFQIQQMKNPLFYEKVFNFMKETGLDPTKFPPNLNFKSNPPFPNFGGNHGSLPPTPHLPKGKDFHGPFLPPNPLKLDSILASTMHGLLQNDPNLNQKFELAVSTIDHHRKQIEKNSISSMKLPPMKSLNIPDPKQSHQRDTKSFPGLQSALNIPNLMKPSSDLFMNCSLSNKKVKLDDFTDNLQEKLSKLYDLNKITSKFIPRRREYPFPLPHLPIPDDRGEVKYPEYLKGSETLAKSIDEYNIPQNQQCNSTMKSPNPSIKMFDIDCLGLTKSPIKDDPNLSLNPKPKEDFSNIMVNEEKIEVCESPLSNSGSSNSPALVGSPKTSDLLLQPVLNVPDHQEIPESTSILYDHTHSSQKFGAENHLKLNDWASDAPHDQINKFNPDFKSITQALLNRIDWKAFAHRDQGLPTKMST